MKSQWITHYEKSGFTGSPRYDESMDFFKQFTVHTRFASMFPIGISPQGRSIECIVVAKGKEFTPEKAKKSGKAIVLIQNGIHAGEIEGKDSGMLLLRDLFKTIGANSPSSSRLPGTGSSVECRLPPDACQPRRCSG